MEIDRITTLWCRLGTGRKEMKLKLKEKYFLIPTEDVNRIGVTTHTPIGFVHADPEWFEYVKQPDYAPTAFPNPTSAAPRTKPHAADILSICLLVCFKMSSSCQFPT